MKKIISFLIILVVLSLLSQPLYASGVNVDASIPSYILIEAKSGKVLCEKDADTKLFPASVTKVMTMFLIMEAIDSNKLAYTDMVTASAYAASMGGSQVYLKEGEQFSVDEMLKSISMASANDACVAMAEHISGSEEAFVSEMNKKAKELGMVNTNFENTNGLDDTVTDHYTTARDIALMSSELINKHPDILKYTSVWMDSVRNGTFGLTNTNRLVRFYKGANGLKTGSTSKAGFCISAAAKRDDMQLICVIMKAPSRDARNEAAKKLLDYGFANYSTFSYDDKITKNHKILNCEKGNADLLIEGFSGVCEKGSANKVIQIVDINKNISAPLKKGDKVGSVKYLLDEELLYEADVTVRYDVERINYFGLLRKLLYAAAGA